MEWFEGKRDWREFYRLKTRFGLGSAFHSAVSNDPEMATAVAEKKRATRGEKAGPPPAEGFTPLMHKLTDLQDGLIAVAHSFGGDSSGIVWSPRPVYLSDELAEQASRRKSRNLLKQLLPHENIDDI